MTAAPIVQPEDTEPDVQTEEEEEEKEEQWGEGEGDGEGEKERLTRPGYRTVLPPPDRLRVLPPPGRATATILIPTEGEDRDLARTAILTLPSDRGFAIESPIYKIAVFAKSRSLHTILCVARSWSSGILVYIILYVRTAILPGPPFCNQHMHVHRPCFSACR